NIIFEKKDIIETFINQSAVSLKRRLAEDQTKASLKEKEVLLKEIHHRVKNNLQIISSLLSLQSGYIDDDQALSMFNESKNRVKSMALIHEKLYQSETLASIDFAGYIQDLAEYLLRMYGAASQGIRLSVDVRDVSLDIDTAIPCGLIINELVSNSLKYAFPKDRKNDTENIIKIELYEYDNNQLTLSIGDNGIGFPEDVDFQDTDSLGLQLVNTLTEQLDGSIELDGISGTKFSIDFPDPNKTRSE
ncbi:hypothetical protein GF312_04605, partial [Candidatus Poribacteria bacterium]|nr:hypothetical protein [Candidatus Poribacteria bacterium]